MEHILSILFVIIAVPTIVCFFVFVPLLSIPKEKTMEEIQRDMMNAQTFRLAMFNDKQAYEFHKTGRIKTDALLALEWKKYNEKLDKIYKPKL
jgi:hypothetical protein